MVTDLGILGFDDESKRMKVEAMHPGVTQDEVQDNNGFELMFETELATTEPPTATELAVLRELGPDRVYIA